MTFERSTPNIFFRIDAPVRLLGPRESAAASRRSTAESAESALSSPRRPVPHDGRWDAAHSQRPQAYGRTYAPAPGYSTISAGRIRTVQGSCADGVVAPPKHQGPPLAGGWRKRNGSWDRRNWAAKVECCTQYPVTAPNYPPECSERNVGSTEPRMAVRAGDEG